MKKIAVMLLALVLSASVCACGKEKKASSKSAPAEESKPIVYVLAPDAEDVQNVTADDLNTVKSILEARLAGAAEEYSVTVDENAMQLTVVCPDSLMTNLLTEKGVTAFVSPEGAVALTNADIRSATAEYDEQQQEHYIKIVFTDEGAAAFSELTSASVGKTIEVYMDRDMIFAPMLYAPITDGETELHSDYTEASAIATANLMNADPLPFRLTIVSSARPED